MSVIQKSFGKTKDGREASLFAIENANGMKVEVTNFGINIVKVIVPDKNGKLDDIALGYDTIEGYYENDNCFGATIILLKLKHFYIFKIFGKLEYIANIGTTPTID